MGLLTELALLPVAPLRFTIWVAEQIDDEVDREQRSPAAIVQQLREIAQARQQGSISEEEAAEAEARVIEAYAEEEPTTGAGEGGAEDG